MRSGNGRPRWPCSRPVGGFPSEPPPISAKSAEMRYYYFPRLLGVLPNEIPGAPWSDTLATSAPSPRRTSAAAPYVLPENSGIPSVANLRQPKPTYRRRLFPCGSEATTRHLQTTFPHAPHSVRGETESVLHRPAEYLLMDIFYNELESLVGRLFRTYLRFREDWKRRDVPAK